MDHWKQQVKLARKPEEPQSEEEFVVLAEVCCGVRYRCSNRSGFSPMQRDFGSVHRLLGLLPSYDERVEELRQAATSAWADSEPEAENISLHGPQAPRIVVLKWTGCPLANHKVVQTQHPIYPMETMNEPMPP